MSRSYDILIRFRADNSDDAERVVRSLIASMPIDLVRIKTTSDDWEQALSILSDSNINYTGEDIVDRLYDAGWKIEPL